MGTTGENQAVAILRSGIIAKEIDETRNFRESIYYQFDNDYINTRRIKLRAGGST